METSAVEQRVQFVWDFTSGQWAMTELCERYDITRPTGYKWIDRYRGAGEAGLAERSRAPHACPHRTSASIETLILAVRKQYGWGAKKLLQVLVRRNPTRVWPARSILLCVTNDFIWWIPFTLYLVDSWPEFRRELSS